MKASEFIKKPVVEGELNLAKTAVKKAGKYAPLGAGVAFGLADTAARAADKDYVGAGLAGLSTAAATVPGPGTAISTGLDAFNYARDEAKDAGGWKPLGKKVAKGLATQEPFLPEEEQEVDEEGLISKGVRWAGSKLPSILRRGEKAIEQPAKAKFTTDAERVLDFSKPGGGLPKAATNAADAKPKGFVGQAADAAKQGVVTGIKKLATGTTLGVGGGGIGYGAYKYLTTPSDDKDAADAAAQDKAPTTDDSIDALVKQKTDAIYEPSNTAISATTPLSQDEIETAKLIRGDIKEETKKLDPKVLAAIQRGIYGNESSYGKAKTDKPNYAGARGPMQIIPSTFDWMKSSGIIPKEYDIKDPEHNRAAGNALIAHYYNKYEGDPAKVFAAYYAGPGSINKDGTINAHWRDRKNPRAPDVGRYIDQGLAKAGLTNITYASARPRDTQLATLPAGGATKPSIDVKDLAKDQTSLAALAPKYEPAPMTDQERQDSARAEASRISAVAKAAAQFNKQYAAKEPEELAESKKVQVNESINTNADLVDLLRLAGRRKI